MKRLGVDWDRLIRPRAETVDEVFGHVEKIAKMTRTKFPNKERPVTIIWDSLAQTASKIELEGSYDPMDYMAVKAREISLAMRKLTSTISLEYITFVVLNQIKLDLKVKNPYLDPYTTPGGKAIPFAASVRIRLTPRAKIKDTMNDILGINTEAEVVKNRMGPPKRKVKFPIMFDYGVDDAQSIYDYLCDIDFIKKSAGYTKFELNGEQKSMRHSEWSKFFGDNKEDIMQILDTNLIRKY